MLGFPHSPQNLVQDGLGARGALLQGGHIAALTIHPPLHGVEMLAPGAGPRTQNTQSSPRGRRDPGPWPWPPSPTTSSPQPPQRPKYSQLGGWFMSCTSFLVSLSSSSSGSWLRGTWDPYPPPLAPAGPETPQGLLLNPPPWLAVAPVASPPDFTSAWERKMGARGGPGGLRGTPPGRAAASQGLCHFHLHREGRAGEGAGRSIGGRSGGPWERRGRKRPSIRPQGA